MTARKGKPLRNMSIRGTLSRPAEPPLCPTCWNSMRLAGKTWECPKHGKPDRP